jgi:tryptophan 2,3-dioxygenase
MKRATYWDYIRVEELLGLQCGHADSDQSNSNDEVLFIVVHQIYELWFKLVLRELSSARDFFRQNPVPDHQLARAVRALRRASTVMGQTIDHFDVMETLTTRDFLAFRDQLVPASGFQSAQLREMEILLGLDDKERIPLGREGSYLEALKQEDGSSSPAHARVMQRLEDPVSLKDVLNEWLFRTPIDGSTWDDPNDEQHVREFLEAFVVAHRGEAEKRIANVEQQAVTEQDLERLRQRYRTEIEQAQRFLFGKDEDGLSKQEERKRSRVRAALIFIESYRELPLLAWPREVVDTVVELEQKFVMFRQRHARMVERVIGRRTGTGGSSGVEYLDRTATEYRIFRNFWAVRTLLLRQDVLPPLKHSEAYGFRFKE